MSELSGEFNAEQFSVFDVPPEGPKDYELIIARTSTSPDVDSQLDAVPITPSESRGRGMRAEPAYEPASPRPDVGPVADHYAELFHAVLRDYMDHRSDVAPAATEPADRQQLLEELDGFVSDQGGGRQQQGVRVELAGLDPNELLAARRFMAEFPDTTEWPED